MTPPTLSRRRFQHGLALLPALFAGLARPVFAHGDAHKKPARPAPVIREQQAWGIAAEPHEATRTVEIRMQDSMRFTPDQLQVLEGETLRLRVVNQGQMLHEIVIGTPQALEAHAAMMKKFPNMEHDEPYMAHVPVGQRGEITWTFNRPGEFAFACLIPGHFDAGMRGTVIVAPKA